MSSRISTSMMFNQSVSLMMAKQAKLSHLEQQIATGSKIVSAMARSLATELRYEQREGRGTHAVMELSLSGLAPPEAADG